jgi:putative DNA primase/helicase
VIEKLPKKSITLKKSTIDQPKERVKIAYLPIPATDSPKTEITEKKGLGEVRETIYPYSDSKWTTRTEWLDPSKAKGYNKKIAPWHLNAEGKAVNKKGEEPWPPYRLEEAIQAAKETNANAIMGAEGEKSVEQYRKIEIACTTLMGSSWGNADCKQLAEILKKEGLIFVYHPDNDEPGKRKAQKIQNACFEEGVECVVLNPKDLDEGVPEAGDIVDIIQADLDVEDFIRRLEVAIKIAREKEYELSLEIDNLIPDSFSPNENCEQQVFNILYKDHSYICVDGILCRWEGNYYQAVDESMEKKRIRDILNTLPKKNKNGDITYPFATYAKVNDCLNWAKVSFGVSRQDVNPQCWINRVSARKRSL